jgi:hypothetical protein
MNKIIPNIIHQYYPYEIIPNKIKKLMDKWRTTHQNWEYIIYTPLKLKELGLNPDINIAKFEIINKSGGFFIDYHFEPIKKLDELLDDGEIILIGNEHPFFFKSINQDFFGGIPQHSVWKEAIKNKKIINNGLDDIFIDENLFVSTNKCDYITDCNTVNCKYKYPESFAIYHYFENNLITKIFCFMKKYIIKILTFLTFLLYFIWFKNAYTNAKETFTNIKTFIPDFYSVNS